MKKTFKVPSLEIVEVNPTDIIATSDIYIGGEGEFDARPGNIDLRTGRYNVRYSDLDDFE